MNLYRRLIESIEAEGLAALVQLTRVRGSTPREAGTMMAARPSGGFHGTIGGGALDWRALAPEAREALRRRPGNRQTRRVPRARA